MNIVILFYFTYVIGIIATWFKPGWFVNSPVSWDEVYDKSAMVMKFMPEEKVYIEKMLNNKILVRSCYSALWFVLMFSNSIKSNK